MKDSHRDHEQHGRAHQDVYTVEGTALLQEYVRAVAEISVSLRADLDPEGVELPFETTREEVVGSHGQDVGADRGR